VSAQLYYVNSAAIRQLSSIAMCQLKCTLSTQLPATCQLSCSMLAQLYYVNSAAICQLSSIAMCHLRCHLSALHSVSSADLCQFCCEMSAQLSNNLSSQASAPCQLSLNSSAQLQYIGSPAVSSCTMVQHFITRVPSNVQEPPSD
jgi:hypothetical protein